MNRREFLHRGGALSTVVGLAGCLGSASDDETAPGDVGTHDGTETTDRDLRTDGGTNRENDEDSDEFSGIRSVYDEPFRTIPLGDRDDVPFPENNRPHHLRLWNDADAARAISFRVARDEETLLDRTVEFAADAYLTVVLNEPAEYEVFVGLANDEPTTFEVSRRRFDCNASSTAVGVLADGRVETVTSSTLLGCYGPKVAETAFSVGRSQCGTEHSATVAFDHEQVCVEGRVRTATPRADLELADVAYDGEAGLLTVRVRASDSDDSGAGTQCTGEVAYEATVGFDNALPGEVLVVHESMDETVEVTRAGRSK